MSRRIGGAPAVILGTSEALLGRSVTTAEVVAACKPEHDAARWEARTGIQRRYWVDPLEMTLARHAAVAVEGALDAAGIRATDLKRVILVTTAEGDLIGSATANAVAVALGLDGTCDAFDVSNACTGFLTGLDLAARCVATGLGPVAVVSAEQFSRAIRPQDHRPYLVMGDAAAAAVVGEGSDADTGFVSSFLGNQGGYLGAVSVQLVSPEGSDRVERHTVFSAKHKELNALASEAMLPPARAALDAAGLTLDDVDWIVPHQPNGVMLQAIVGALQTLGERSVRERVLDVVADVGSVGSAATAVGLHRVAASRGLEGMVGLLVASGGGMSYGAMVYRG